jgi:hypothetical protein
MKYQNEGPIPGQSLTTEPGNAAWERPPKHAGVDEAFEAYLDKFEVAENKDALFQTLEAGIPLTTLVKTLTREAVRKGIHTIDAAVVLRPAVHEYIRHLAETAGISYVEDGSDLVKDQAKLEEERSAVGMYVQKGMKE